MKADLVLIISPENPLMAQLGKVLGKLCTMYDFTTIEKNDKYVTLRHDETGLVVAYTTEEKIMGKIGEYKKLCYNFEFSYDSNLLHCALKSGQCDEDCEYMRNFNINCL